MIGQTPPTDIESVEGIAFQERADYVDETVLKEGTVKGDLFDKVHDALIDKSMCLVVGPRGCGKTHMMRYTWLQCAESKALPLSVYVSFNRYLRLEPFLKSKANALTYFQTWVLCRIIRGMNDIAERINELQGLDPAEALNLTKARVEAIIARLERAATPTPEEEQDASRVTIEGVGKALDLLSAAASRSRSVLLLDDAALTLTPEYLVEFFDVVRVIKSRTISPKCSVYPGTTEYGPRFHARQEAREVRVWLAIEDANYVSTMLEIGSKRLGPLQERVSQKIKEQLTYAAFGMPRAYLTLLRDLATSDGQQQQALNSAIQSHRDGILAEYRSLATKLPHFRILVDAGSDLFQAMIDTLRDANTELQQEKQLLVGIEKDDFTVFAERMTKLLIEAGLVFEHPEVSHGGPDRTYRRFTPHLAALMAVRAFSVGRRGQSAAEVVEYLQRRSVKHPVRRKLATLLGKDRLAELRIDLPACQKCGTPRLNEDQKFCHNCGSQLADSSTFTRLMALSIDEVPGLTEFKRESLRSRKIETVGNLLALEDPGTELRKARYVGPHRSIQILDLVHSYIDEFLS